MINAIPSYDMGLTNWGAIELGLYFIVIGYYILLFFYFILKFRTSKKMYWIYFAGVTLALAIGRIFFMLYYFFLPDPAASVENPIGSPVTGELLLTVYRLATFFTWMGIASAMGVLGILLLPTPVDKEREIKEESKIKQDLVVFFNNDKRRLIVRGILILIPIIVGISVLLLNNELFLDPDYNIAYQMGYDQSAYLIGKTPGGRFLNNFVFSPLLVFLIPLMFFYLAWKTFGVLRKSYALNGLGFLLYFAGRIFQGVFDTMGWPHMEATIPPLLIIASLLILAIANNVEQLK
ncbi:MAG: hypothetical protein JW891_02310 [Candidatus Lokiarchaeota archaeon]|nr:hypothetical protein [Candidatus Lokiarchaeota archaeon]